MSFPVKNSKIVSVFGLSLGKSILFFTLIISLFIAPSITHAGIWSDLTSTITGIFTGPSAAAESQPVIEPDTQDSVLEAPTTSELTPNLSPTLLATDDGAFLNEAGPSTLPPDAVDNSSGQISVYIVHAGDTLASVAKMFNVSVNTILWANDLSKNSTLKLGQSLVILPMSGVMHIVVSGDTLQSIAKKYGGDVNEIADFNDLKITDKLVLGDTILIPDGESSYSVSAPTPTKGSSPIYVAGKKVYEPLLVNPSTLPNYDGYYAKPFIVGTKTQGLHGHNAVDYGMPVGSPIYAAASGIVIISKTSGYNGGYGKYVVIQHPNNTQTLYGHMSNPVVSAGQSVSQGQLIGLSGNTGMSTGPHLHFEVRGAKNPF